MVKIHLLPQAWTAPRDHHDTRLRGRKTPWIRAIRACHRGAVIPSISTNYHASTLFENGRRYCFVEEQAPQKRGRVWQGTIAPSG